MPTMPAVIALCNPSWAERAAAESQKSARTPVVVSGQVIRQRLMQVVALTERRPLRQPAAVVGVHGTPPFDFSYELERAAGR